MKWIKLDSRDIPAADGIRKVKAGTTSVCLVRSDGRLYATSVKCPHAGADLSGGWCEGGRLICPYHRHAFDLETGRGDPGQGNYMHVYELQDRDDGLYIGLKESFFSRLFAGKKEEL